MGDTPFIKLFSSPWNKYFYDVGRNEIIKISEQLYNCLQLMESGSISWQEMIAEPSEELSSLLDCGYLSCKRPSTIRHPLSDFSQCYLERKIDMITLQLTQECNFRCDYCVYSDQRNQKQRSHSSKRMSWKTAKSAVDFYFSHSIDSESRSIGLYGGEPLLQFDLIKRIVEYAKQKSRGKYIEFHMTTNGSLLRDGVVPFLVAHDVRLLISVDGKKASHDKNRVFKDGTGTYELIIKNLSRIREQYPEYYEKIQINTVLDPTNDYDSMIELSDELPGLHRENFRYSYLETDDNSVFQTPGFIMNDEYQSFLAYLSLCGKYPKEELSAIGFQRFQDAEKENKRFKSASGTPDNLSHGGPCIAGKARLLITVNGVFYPCERVNENMHMCIGNLITGFDYQRIKNLMNVGEMTTKQCKDCWAIRHCSICAKMCDDGEMLSASEKLKHCDASKYAASNKIRAIILQNEVNYSCSKGESI